MEQAGKRTSEIPRTDFHIHATYYRDRGRPEDMTVADVVRRCEELSFDAVGIVDHLDGSARHPLAGFDGLMHDFRKADTRIRLSAGAELDILDEKGSVTGSAELKERLGLDYLLAGVHRLLKEMTSIEDLIDRYQRIMMGVLENCDFVDVIAHPWAGAHAVGEGKWSFDLIPQHYRGELLQALSERGVAIEFNTRWRRDLADPAFREFMREIRDARVKVAVGSDSHAMEGIGASFVLDGFLDEMGFPAEQIWMPSDS